MSSKRRVVYKGPVFSVEEWNIPKTGTRFARIVGDDAVGVLPILGSGKILLERQYRHSLDRYLYEIPAGHIDGKESPPHAARRELLEETGYYAGKLTKLVSFYEAPGSYTQIMHVYLAEDLKQGSHAREVNEIISLKSVTLKEAMGMIKTNTIRDAKTICGILYYSAFQK